MIQVKVRLMDGRDLELPIELSESVSILRSAVASRLVVSDVARIRLIQRGRVLEDSSILSESLDPECVVHCVLRPENIPPPTPPQNSNNLPTNPRISIGSRSTSLAASQQSLQETIASLLQEMQGESREGPPSVSSTNSPILSMQDLGPGIYMGSVDLSQNELTSFSLDSLLGQMLRPVRNTQTGVRNIRRRDTQNVTVGSRSVQVPLARATISVSNSRNSNGNNNNNSNNTEINPNSSSSTNTDYPSRVEEARGVSLSLSNNLRQLYSNQNIDLNPYVQFSNNFLPNQSSQENISEAVSSLLWDLMVSVNRLQVPLTQLSQRCRDGSFVAGTNASSVRAERIAELRRMQTLLRDLADVSGRSADVLGDFESFINNNNNRNHGNNNNEAMVRNNSSSNHNSDNQNVYVTDDSISTQLEQAIENAIGQSMEIEMNEVLRNVSNIVSSSIPNSGENNNENTTTNNVDVTSVENERNENSQSNVDNSNGNELVETQAPLNSTSITVSPRIQSAPGVSNFIETDEDNNVGLELDENETTTTTTTNQSVVSPSVVSNNRNDIENANTTNDNSEILDSMTNSNANSNVNSNNNSGLNTANNSSGSLSSSRSMNFFRNIFRR